MYPYGAPKIFSAGLEFFKAFFEKFIPSRGTLIQPRPSRFSYKTGHVECKNEIFLSLWNVYAKKIEAPMMAS